MSIWVVAGTAIALVLILVRALGPHEWRHPTRWHMPEIGPSLMIWVGANALTAAVRIAVVLLQGKVGLRGPGLGSHHVFQSLGEDDGTMFLGGALAAALVGIIGIRDGMRRVVPLPRNAGQGRE